jgi:STAM-binding protein
MDAQEDHRPSRPLSLKEIDVQANDFQWNPTIPFKYWVRAAETIYLEVSSYDVHKHASLFVNRARR